MTLYPGMGFLAVWLLYDFHCKFFIRDFKLKVHGMLYFASDPVALRVLLAIVYDVEIILYPKLCLATTLLASTSRLLNLMQPSGRESMMLSLYLKDSVPCCKISQSKLSLYECINILNGQCRSAQIEPDPIVHFQTKQDCRDFLGRRRHRDRRTQWNRRSRVDLQSNHLGRRIPPQDCRKN